VSTGGHRQTTCFDVEEHIHLALYVICIPEKNFLFAGENIVSSNIQLPSVRYLGIRANQQQGHILHAVFKNV
jgi:hypothetical protein